MFTPRRLYGTCAGLTILVAVLTQQVVSEGWLNNFDIDAIKSSRRIGASNLFFSITVALGLRGLILAICLPLLGWLSWKKKSWIPVGGFLLVLLFETGLAGALKMAVGRSFPYEAQRGHLMYNPGELAFPSGHTTNAVALWGYTAWYLTRGWSRVQRARVGIGVAFVAAEVAVSSWLIRTHWPTDTVCGFALGGIALAAVVSLYTALGLNQPATSEH